jgi:hypothetical protein
MDANNKAVPVGHFEAVFRIRTGFNADPHIDPDPAYKVNADTDPGFCDDKKLGKIYRGKKLIFF